MTFAYDETIWRDAYADEPPAKKVKRIKAATGLSVQDIADRIGLNRLGPDTGENQNQQAQHEQQRQRQEAQRAWQDAQRRREEAERATREKLWQAAERWHAEFEARREKVNGKAGRGNPKIDRARLFSLHDAGLGVRAIARELGCSHVAVMKIIRAAGNQ